MMRSAAHFAFAVLLLVVASTGCTRRKDPEVTPTTTTTTNTQGGVKMEFFNKVGSSSLVMDNGTANGNWYINEHGDSFRVTLFNYYVSNVVLNGTTPYTESNSYHLIEQSADSSKNFTMGDVPPGTYTGVTFTIGVDSLRNVSGAQTGALDPSYGMFWTWNSGYIMWKFEGISPSSTAAGKLVLFHAGGFSGQYKAQRTITLTFPQPIVVSNTGQNHVHVTADLLTLFKTRTVIDFSTTNLVNTPTATSSTLANNFSNIFAITYAGL
jgi:hypothetical protein